MDSGTAFIASLMIFSIGTTTASGLNFDPYLFLHIGKGSKARFLLPYLFRYLEGALLPERIGFLETREQYHHPSRGLEQGA